MNKVDYRDQLLETFKDSPKIANFISGPRWCLSDQIVGLEMGSSMSQEECAKVCGISLNDFLMLELGDPSYSKETYSKCIKILKNS